MLAFPLAYSVNSPVLIASPSFLLLVRSRTLPETRLQCVLYNRLFGCYFILKTPATPHLTPPPLTIVGRFAHDKLLLPQRTRSCSHPFSSVLALIHTLTSFRLTSVLGNTKFVYTRYFISPNCVQILTSSNDLAYCSQTQRNPAMLARISLSFPLFRTLQRYTYPLSAASLCTRTKTRTILGTSRVR